MVRAAAATGGQQPGSIRGHGACLAPDRSADRLQREAVALLDLWARRTHGKGCAAAARGASASMAGARFACLPADKDTASAPRHAAPTRQESLRPCPPQPSDPTRRWET
jgi:hypothetical protein